MATLEQLHTDASGVPGPEPGGLPWLNSKGSAEKVVRGFFADVFRAMESDTETFTKVFKERCEAMDRLFLQYMPGFNEYGGYKTGPWNTPDQLGAFLASYLGISGEHRKMAGLAFANVSAPALRMVMRGEPDERWQKAVDEAVDKLVRALTGVGDTV